MLLAISVRFLQRSTMVALVTRRKTVYSPYTRRKSDHLQKDLQREHFLLVVRGCGLILRRGWGGGGDWKISPLEKYCVVPPLPSKASLALTPLLTFQKLWSAPASPYEVDVLSVSCLVASGDVITFSIQFFPGITLVLCLTLSILFHFFRSVVGFVRHWVPQVPTISYPQWLILWSTFSHLIFLWVKQ